MGKELRNVLGCTSAIQLQLSIDCYYLRYKEKVSRYKGKEKYKEKWEAVEVERSVIHL
jgi:hypothetical protein